MRFGGYLVGRPAQTRAPLILFGRNLPGQLGAVDERYRPLWTQGSSRIHSFVATFTFSCVQSSSARPSVRGECFPALHNLRSLTLFNGQDISEEGFRTRFSALRETLIRLFIDAVAASFSTFAALVGYNFPMLKPFNSFHSK